MLTKNIALSLLRTSITDLMERPDLTEEERMYLRDAEGAVFRAEHALKFSAAMGKNEIQK